MRVWLSKARRAQAVVLIEGFSFGSPCCPDLQRRKGLCAMAVFPAKACKLHKSSCHLAPA